MDELEKSKIYTQCINLWGIYPQMLMVVEELGELIVAVSKYDRKQATSDDIAGEIADVRIMCDQLMHVVGVSEYQVKQKEIAKLERLKERIKKFKEDKENKRKNDIHSIRNKDK